MFWKLPPLIKVYEALGSIGDERIELLGNESAKVYSSSRQKFYTVTYDPATNAIMANDNGSYWQGYLGYPSIAFLLVKGILPLRPMYAQALSHIPWKRINTRFQNNFEKTQRLIDRQLLAQGVDMTDFSEYCETIVRALAMLRLQSLGQKTIPPSSDS